MQDKRKELRGQYAERDVQGGIYRIVNNVSGKFLLLSTTNMPSAHNKLGFSRATGSCVHPKLQRDWAAQGAEAFAIEELELLKKKQEQSAKDFQDDIQVLFEYWNEKLPVEGRY